MAKYGTYLPLIGNYSTIYYSKGNRFHNIYKGLACTVKWGDESCCLERFDLGKDDITYSTISHKKLSDGKYHLVLKIEPLYLADGCNYFDRNTGPYSTFKARIVLN